MSKVKFQCQYCSHEFEKEASYWHTDFSDDKCIACGDKNLKVIKSEGKNNDPFGYNSDKPKEDAYIRRK